MTVLAEIIEKVLRLKVQERAALAEKLLASPDDLSQEEAERLWADEAERRLQECRAGRAQSVPAEDVVAKAERLFR